MIEIGDDTLAVIRAHAEQTYPRECCGALLGNDSGGEKVVTRLAPAQNQRDDEAARRRFLMSSDDYRAIEAEARTAGVDILGFYHSHPDHPAEPSEHDRENALPWYSYIIVSVENGRSARVSSWVLADDRSVFTGEEISKPRE